MEFKREPNSDNILQLQSLLVNLKSGWSNSACKLTFFSCYCRSCKLTIEKTFLLTQIFNSLGDCGTHYEATLKYDILFYMVYINDINRDFIVVEIERMREDTKKERQKQQLLHALYLSVCSAQYRLHKQYTKTSLFNERHPDNQIDIRIMPDIHSDAYKKEYEDQKKIADHVARETRAFKVEHRSFILMHIIQFSFSFIIKTRIEQISDYQLCIRRIIENITCAELNKLQTNANDRPLDLYYNRDRKAFLLKFDKYVEGDYTKVIAKLRHLEDDADADMMRIQASLKVKSVVITPINLYIGVNEAIFYSILLLKDETETFIGVWFKPFTTHRVVFIFKENRVLYDDIPLYRVITILKRLQYALDYSGFCENCHQFNSNKSFMRCGQCRTLYYCSKTCQTIDWDNGHSKLCKKETTLLKSNSVI
jgi:hypothetical protein